MASSSSPKRVLKRGFGWAKLPKAKTKPSLEKQGICVRVYTQTPMKPKSSTRFIARVLLQSGILVTAYIPAGISSSLLEGSPVSLRGNRLKGLPGVRYVCHRPGIGLGLRRSRRNEPADLNAQIMEKLRSIEANVDSMEKIAVKIDQLISSPISEVDA